MRAAESARLALATATARRAEFDTHIATSSAEGRRIADRVNRCRSDARAAAQRRDAAAVHLRTTRESADQAVRDLDDAVDTQHSDEQLDTTARDALRTRLDNLRAMETQARLEAASAQQKLSSAKGRIEFLEDRHADAVRQQSDYEAATLAQRAARLKAQTIARLAGDVATRLAETLAVVATQKKAADTNLQQSKAQRERLVTDTADIEKQWQDATKGQQDADIAAHTATVRREEAEQRARENTGLDAGEIRATCVIPEDFDRDATRTELTAQEKQIRRMGKVNPLAVEEYKALEERYAFLYTQLVDVEKARKDLEDVIESVDAHVTQLFTDAWRDVEAAFPTVFGTLFPGGAGRLILTDPSDMLTTGIDVEARLPGKRVKRLSLLSGGERSLTAIAILVAIFKARPSPFYVMDEVEAALDDVNLRRLLALCEELRQDSQLIMVTHQKPTMDIANVLYGVTMRGDGVTQVISQRMQPLRVE